MTVCILFRSVYVERGLIQSLRHACMLNWTGMLCACYLPFTHAMTLTVLMIDVQAVY